MPKTFADTESQILFLIMVCKMRGLSFKQIQEEIKENLHEDMTINTIRNKIDKMTRSNAEEFHNLKTSNDEYISRVVELKHHLDYYRRLIEQTLYNQEFIQYRNPRMIYKAIEVLYKLDETEFNMLKEMPKLFAWGGVRNQKGMNSVYGDMNTLEEDKTIDQFIISMNQITVPREIEMLQKETEDKNLGAHSTTSQLDKKQNVKRT